MTNMVWFSWSGIIIKTKLNTPKTLKLLKILEVKKNRNSNKNKQLVHVKGRKQKSKKRKTIFKDYENSNSFFTAFFTVVVTFMGYQICHQISLDIFFAVFIMLPCKCLQSCHTPDRPYYTDIYILQAKVNNFG